MVDIILNNCKHGFHRCCLVNSSEWKKNNQNSFLKNDKCPVENCPQAVLNAFTNSTTVKHVQVISANISSKYVVALSNPTTTLSDSRQHSLKIIEVKRLKDNGFNEQSIHMFESIILDLSNKDNECVHNLVNCLRAPQQGVTSTKYNNTKQLLTDWKIKVKKSILNVIKKSEPNCVFQFHPISPEWLSNMWSLSLSIPYAATNARTSSSYIDYKPIFKESIKALLRLEQFKNKDVSDYQGVAYEFYENDNIEKCKIQFLLDCNFKRFQHSRNKYFINFVDLVL